MQGCAAQHSGNRQAPRAGTHLKNVACTIGMCLCNSGTLATMVHVKMYPVRSGRASMGMKVTKSVEGKKSGGTTPMIREKNLWGSKPSGQ